MEVEAREAVEVEASLAPIVTGLENGWLNAKKVRLVQWLLWRLPFGKREGAKQGPPDAPRERLQWQGQYVAAMYQWQ